MAEIKIENSQFTNTNLGDYGTIYLDTCTISMNQHMDFFEREGNRYLEALDKSSKNYVILEEAVTYARQKKGRKFAQILKKYSMDVWKDIFVGIGSNRILEIIQQIIDGMGKFL